jgi:hypothetical protein
MIRAREVIAILFVVFLWPTSTEAQDAPLSPLFRVFLTDGKTVLSYGEYARVDDRLVFTMPTRIRPEPGGFELVSLPLNRVDWPRTEQYASRVHAALYAASRGAADFATLSAEVARSLNEISSTGVPSERLAKAEKARQALAEWPSTHFGYKVAEVREFLGLLDGIIAELRASVGQTRFSLTLTTPLAAAPEPPLPPPTDVEVVEGMTAAAAAAEGPVEKIGLLQKVVDVLDSTMGLLLPEAWAARVRREVTTDLTAERRIETAYTKLRSTTLEASNKAARRRDADELRRLRAAVLEEDARLGKRQPGNILALIATLDAAIDSARQLRTTHDQWSKRASLYRSYRRAMKGSFSLFDDIVSSLEQVRSMSGPRPEQLMALSKRLAGAERKAAKVVPPEELMAGHALVRSAWELAQNAVRLRLQSVSDNSLAGGQQASSAAAGALMLYRKAVTDLLKVMEEPARQ